MCTVIYSPQHDGYLLASVRDENPERTTYAPSFFERNQKRLLHPTDASRKGTWIGCTSENRSVVLLNGAFVNHLPNTRLYSESRGKMVLEAMQSARLKDVLEDRNLENFEPFTLLVFEAGTIHCLRWNGKERFLETPNPDEAHIWSSSTLYPKDQQLVRQRLFLQWMQSEGIRNEADLKAFLHSYNDPHFGFFMQRNDFLRSVSLSIILKDPFAFTFQYTDLVTHEQHEYHLPVQKTDLKTH